MKLHIANKTINYNRNIKKRQKTILGHTAYVLGNYNIYYDEV